MEMLKMHKSYNDNNSNIAEINIKSNLVDFMGESIRIISSLIRIR